MITRSLLTAGIVAGALAAASSSALASSHMDAPLITLDDAANTTDVYAFRADVDGIPYLTTALSVYPFEEPGIGPNAYQFDDNVLYEIHVVLGDDLASGRKTVSYQFEFETTFDNSGTILQSYLAPVDVDVDGTILNVNRRQSYTVTRRQRRSPRRTTLGTGVVPPNNQGLLTRFYNQGDDGESKAKEGVSSEAELDRFTKAGLAELSDGYRSFAGQRDDGFYADIQSIFDLDFGFTGPNKPFDSQGGYNVHTIVLQIPLAELGGSEQVAGVYATTSRRRVSVLSNRLDRRSDRFAGGWVQVGRQGNPLFCEALVGLADKDNYNRTSPTRDMDLFQQYALDPELAQVLIPLFGLPDNRITNRTDIAAIFIPDVIKVDLSTAPAQLAGAPNDPGFERLSVFGGDTLVSSVQPGLPGFPAGTIPGGWPNGRRFGDDVIDITVIAVLSDLRTDPLQVFGGLDPTLNIDKVDQNDITYNKVMPYAATPLNGRNHGHH